MIQKIDSGVPSNTNRKILNLLYRHTSFKFSSDDYLPFVETKPDHGLACVSFSDGVNNNAKGSFNDELNVYGGFIFDLIQKNLLIKFKKMNRIYWNWYNRSSLGTEYHQDGIEDNKYTIVYNLHTNDGGTNFKINDKIIFETSVESEAIVFPSKIWHKGVAPTNNLNRFSLNIIGEI